MVKSFCIKFLYALFDMALVSVKSNPPLITPPTTGTIFPRLIVPVSPNFVIKSQIIYAKKKNVVWGISESAFYNFDINLNYQYKAVGVPWLGLKRGLIDDTVISPYSTMLALMVNPKAAYKNLTELLKYDMLGKYGFYEAIDFTPGRLKLLNSEKNFAQVKTYMAHHKGMSLVAINNVVNDFIMPPA